MNLSFRQWFVLVLFSAVAFFSSTIYTLHAVFFPFQVEKRGISTIESGIIFGISSISTVFSSLFIGSFLSYSGVRRTLCFSTFLGAVSVGLFGVLGTMYSHILLLVCAILLRILQGIAYAGIYVSIYSALETEFKEFAPFAYSVIGVFDVFGVAAGAPIGGFLFEIGGFICPFITVGAIIFTLSVFLPVVYYDSPLKDVKLKSKPYNVFEAMKILMVTLNYLVVFTQSLGVTFLIAILPYYLVQNFHLSSGDTSLILGISFLITIIVNPLSGYCISLYVDAKLVMVIGAILALVGSILIGPIPFLMGRPNLILTIFAFIIWRIGFSPVNLTAFLSLFKEILRAGFPENPATRGMISGGYVAIHALGGGIGPLLSGLVVHTFGSATSTGYGTFGITAIVFILVLSYTSGSFLKFCCSCCPKEAAAKTNDENSHLLSSS